jgi:hypothetical protein
MDLHGISDADKHLLYGLLLRKRRSLSHQKKVLAVIRGSLDIDGRIAALMDLQAEEDGALAAAAAARVTRAGAGPRGARIGVIVVDMRTEVVKLLRKCALKRSLAFQRIGESFDAVHLIGRLRARLIILNEPLPLEDYPRYYEICRAIEPKVRILFLCAPPRGLEASDLFRRNTRFLPKPINMERLEAAAAELLGL